MCDEKNEVYNIETLMREYGNDVLRTAYMYVKDYHLAEDIFQDVFLKVNQKLASFKGDSSIKTWIIRITINTCKDYIKSAYAKRVVPMMEFMEDKVVSNDDYDNVIKQEQNKLIRDSIMNLPIKYREILICVYFQEMSMNEAADALVLSVGTVKSRLSRAKDKLKNILEGRI